MKTLRITALLAFAVATMTAQEKQQDTTSVETLEEVLVQSVRVKADSPITHSW